MARPRTRTLYPDVQREVGVDMCNHTLVRNGRILPIVRPRARKHSENVPETKVDVPTARTIESAGPSSFSVSGDRSIGH